MGEDAGSRPPERLLSSRRGGRGALGRLGVRGRGDKLQFERLHPAGCSSPFEDAWGHATRSDQARGGDHSSAFISPLLDRWVYFCECYRGEGRGAREFKGVEEGGDYPYWWLLCVSIRQGLKVGGRVSTLD